MCDADILIGTVAFLTAVFGIQLNKMKKRKAVTQ